RPCWRVGGGLHLRRHRRRNAADAGSAVGAPSGCENVLAPFAPWAVLLQERNWGRSTRLGCEYVLARFTPRAVLLQERSRGRSTRVGCENVLAPFAPRAVLLQEPGRGRSTLRVRICACPGSHRGRCSYRNEAVVGAPAPGANMCWRRFTPRAVLLQEPGRGRSTLRVRKCPGSGSHRGRCSYRSQPVVGAPAPGANKCRPGANGVARVRYSLDELVLVPLRFLPGTPGHVPACEKMYNGGISRVARGCPAFPDFTSGDSMDTFIQMLRNISPEVYESLKTAVELGKWADGRKLTQEQKELCLQAIIAWEMDNLPEEERTGYIAQSCKNASKAPANLDESLFSAAKGTLH